MTTQHEDDQEARFLDAVQREHDADPDAWHQGMLKPPAPRTSSCAFCGVPWDEVRAAGRGVD